MLKKRALLVTPHSSNEQKVESKNRQKNTFLYSDQLPLLLSTIVQAIRHDSCHWVDTTRQAVLFCQSGESVRSRIGGLLAAHVSLPYSMGLFSQEVG